MEDHKETNQIEQPALQMSLYDLNKQAMSAFELLTEEKFNKKLSEMGDWFSYAKDKYFMVLCHEIRDYTIIHFVGESKKIYEATTALKEFFNNRGHVISIDFIDASGAYCIWVRDCEGENFAYYLFPYDIGVEEI